MYPSNTVLSANGIRLDPAFYTGLLAGVTNLEAAIQRLDALTGIGQEDCIYFLSSPWRATQGLWGGTADPGMFFYGYIANDWGNARDGDAVEVDFLVRGAGTYTLWLNAPTDSDQAIIKVFMDAVQVGVPGGYDTYAAVPDYAAVISIPNVVLSAGVHTLRVMVDGANVASSNRLTRLHACELVRTA